MLRKEIRIDAKPTQLGYAKMYFWCVIELSEDGAETELRHGWEDTIELAARRAMSYLQKNFNC